MPRADFSACFLREKHGTGDVPCGSQGAGTLESAHGIPLRFFMQGAD
jgi:hypothetical protein